MDIEIVRRKVAQMERALTRVKMKLPRSIKEFRRDFDAQDIVYRNFQIAVQNAVDMGSHWVAEKGLPPPRTMGEVFDFLGDHGPMSVKLTREFRKAVTVRNIIVHDYARLDHAKAYALIKKFLVLAPQFCKTFLKIKI